MSSEDAELGHSKWRFLSALRQFFMLKNVTLRHFMCVFTVLGFWYVGFRNVEPIDDLRVNPCSRSYCYEQLVRIQYNIGKIQLEIYDKRPGAVIE